MNRRRLALGVPGVALVALALVGTGLVGGLVPAEAAVAVLGTDYFFVALIGGGSLAVAAAVLVDGDAVDQARMPDPESVTAVPAPGDDLGDRLDGWRVAVPVLSRRARREVRDRLREDAVTAVRRARNCDEAAAVERVDSGAWTTDPRAAAFLASDRSASLADVLAGAVRGETPFGDGARRTADAVADVELGGTERESEAAR
ncbi:DUF7269 family protein [Halosimplex salinum]|uniref:DUF7269 family protein n=1 Tax=Halosimplex salinum TaxID=1710538 RepID=UPI000F47317C|nr:hypothetical protein [Halosimplex salinum]